MTVILDPFKKLSDVHAEDLLTAVQAKGAGYAISQTEELEVLQNISRATGVSLSNLPPLVHIHLAWCRKNYNSQGQCCSNHMIWAGERLSFWREMRGRGGGVKCTCGQVEMRESSLRSDLGSTSRTGLEPDEPSTWHFKSNLSEFLQGMYTQITHMVGCMCKPNVCHHMTCICKPSNKQCLCTNPQALCFQWDTIACEL